MTIQEIREAGHPEIAELAELRRKEVKGGVDSIDYCFSWCDTKEGFEFWDLVSERSYKEAYKFVPLEKIKKRIMKGKKKDRLKQKCYEIVDEYFNDKEKVKGIKEKIFEKPELEEKKEEPDATIHLGENDGGVIYAKKPGFWGVVGNPDATVDYYKQRLVHPLKEEENKESLNTYKNGDDYAENGTIKLKCEGIVKDSIPESMEEYLESPVKWEFDFSVQMNTLKNLIGARDVYRQGWKPNYKSLDWKYCINYEAGNVSIIQLKVTHEIFSFQSEEVRDKFFKNFKKELEEVKELWS